MTVIKRGGSYGVRILAEGKQFWVGSFPTRELAEEAEAEAKRAHRAPRKCVKCGKRFKPANERRMRCDDCIPSASTPTQDDHWLYRCFDSKLNLLYIGITSTGVRRLRKHGNDKEWWPRVDTMKLEHFATAEEARKAEKAAIRKHKPPYNRRDLGPTYGTVVSMRRWRKDHAS